MLLSYLVGAIYFYTQVDQKTLIGWVEKTVITVMTSQARARIENMPHFKEALAAMAAERAKDGQGPAPSKVLSTSTILAPAPQLKPGQTLKFRYQIHDLHAQKIVKDQTLDWEVISASLTKSVWEDENGTSEIFGGNPFLPPSSASGNSIRRAEKNEIIGDGESIFPLTAGKTIVVKVNPQADLGGDPYDVTCTVGQLGQTATVAGAFKTVRVDCAADRPGSPTDTFHYSPQLNHWVLRESTYATATSSFRLQAQLVGYTLPAPRAPASR